MCQRFFATERTEFLNGAIGWRNDSPFDCLGPFAKVQNCPIQGTTLRLTCYATNYADTYFSVPACTRHKGKYITGFFTLKDEECVFIPYSKFNDFLGIK